MCKKAKRKRQKECKEGREGERREKVRMGKRNPGFQKRQRRDAGMSLFPF